MRVAVVHNLRPGGAHRRLQEQMTRMAGDYELTEFLLQGAEPVADRVVTVPLVTTARVVTQALRPPMRYIDLFLLLTAYRRLSKRIREAGVDVVWLNPCMRLQAPGLDVDLARRAVYYCDEPRRQDYDEDARAAMRAATRGLYGPLRRIERAVDRRTVRAVRRCVTNSRYVAEWIRTAYGQEASVIRLGVSSSFFADRSVRRNCFLSVGTLIPSKGHDLAIEAMARAEVLLPLHVVAPHSNETEERRLTRLASERGVTLVISTGISDRDLRRLYQRAVVTLYYLARREPFGLVSLEAQACGSPVVVAAEGGLPETLLAGRTGVCVHRDPQAAAEALRSLVTGGDRWRAMSAAAVRWSAQWSWARSAQELGVQLELTAAGR